MIFAVIGDSLPRERRATAFSVQSILVRIPRVIGAPIGGLLIASLGMIAGIRAALLATLLLALGVLAVQRYGYLEDHAAARPDDAGMRAIFTGMSQSLKRLVVADCLVRLGEGIATSFIVLFVTQTRNFSVVEYGALYAMQQAVAIAFYLPGGRLADMTGRGPLVARTFVFFATFPLAVPFRCAFPRCSRHTSRRTQGTRRAGAQIPHWWTSRLITSAPGRWACTTASGICSSSPRGSPVGCCGSARPPVA